MKMIILGYLLTIIAFISLLFIDPMSAMTLFIIVTILIIGPVLFILGVKNAFNEQRGKSLNEASK